MYYQTWPPLLPLSHSCFYIPIFTFPLMHSRFTFSIFTSLFLHSHFKYPFLHSCFLYSQFYITVFHIPIFYIPIFTIPLLHTFPFFYISIFTFPFLHSHFYAFVFIFPFLHSHFLHSSHLEGMLRWSRSRHNLIYYIKIMSCTDDHDAMGISEGVGLLLCRNHLEKVLLSHVESTFDPFVSHGVIYD